MSVASAANGYCIQNSHADIVTTTHFVTTPGNGHSGSYFGEKHVGNFQEILRTEGGRQQGGGGAVVGALCLC